MNLTRIHEDLLSGLRIRRCCELWCRSHVLRVQQKKKKKKKKNKKKKLLCPEERSPQERLDVAFVLRQEGEAERNGHLRPPSIRDKG